VNSRPFRRASFISPFGPGALNTGPDGTSTITAGLDHWFDAPPGMGPDNIDIKEFVINEWRLQKALGVSHFRLPPDYRENKSTFSIGTEAQINLKMTVPLLRFPTWHRCPNPSCQALIQVSLSQVPTPRCHECKPKDKKNARGREMLQVQFVAICEDGHIQDFPWREWVHKSSSPACNGRLRMHTSSGGTLGALRVRCEGCQAVRDLEGILQGRPETSGEAEEGMKDTPLTFLSARLDGSGKPFLCQGIQPWLGETEPSFCGKSLQGSLRGASNVYFANVASSLYLPIPSESKAKGLGERVEQAGLMNDIKDVIDSLGEVSHPFLRKYLSKKLPDLQDVDLMDAAIDELAAFLDGDTPSVNTEIGEEDNPTTKYRRPEFAIIRNAFESRDLLVERSDMSSYAPEFREFISRVQLVPKLRETRAFAGFSRITPVDSDGEERKRQLWKTPPRSQSGDWLPAYNVFGEGIYIELNSDTLVKWENRPQVCSRLQRLSLRELELRQGQDSSTRAIRITPRFVLVHTLAHLLINQLVFDCGYSSASLRERLYVSSDPEAPMAGLLIYTASGDSEGTMGGLVRRGKPGRLEQTFVSALQSAEWCSSDPVCMEMGKTGQGPGSCNLAACHSCALLPETSCEEFNRFLDRWTVIGEPAQSGLGFFSPFVEAT